MFDLDLDDFWIQIISYSVAVCDRNMVLHQLMEMTGILFCCDSINHFSFTTGEKGLHTFSARI